jgi:hypothetical protein
MQKGKPEPMAFRVRRLSVRIRLRFMEKVNFYVK